jgi:mitochondrial import receptor subunit TOM40
MFLFLQSKDGDRSRSRNQVSLQNIISSLSLSTPSRAETADGSATIPAANPVPPSVQVSEVPGAATEASPPIPSPVKVKDGPSFWTWPNLPNPGSFDNAEGPVKRVLNVDAYEGMRFELNKQMSPQFSISHFLMMGGPDSNAMYNFGANVPHGNQYLTPNGLVNSSVDTGGRVTTRFMTQWSKSIGTRVNIGLGADIEETQFSVEGDFKGKDFSTTFKWMQTQNMFEVNYMQSLTTRIAAGASLTYVPANQVTVPQFVMRYNGRLTTLCAKAVLSPMGTQGTLGYVRKLNNRAAIATEMMIVKGQGGVLESDYSVGYEFNLKTATLKAKYSLNGDISSTVQENTPMGGITFCATMLGSDPNKMMFGFGFSFGGGQ